MGRLQIRRFGREGRKCPGITSLFTGKLPENFVMAVIEGTGYAETASKLNVSVNTVKSQVKIAYRKLKGMWGISENELLLFLIFIYLKKF